MSWRFASTPKWIIRHVVVVALITAMVWAGFWQLRRLDEKREYRDLVEARQELPSVDVSELLPEGAEVDDDAVDDALYRTITAHGTYADDDTLVVENRTYNGSPGGWVLTPIVLDDGRAIVVNRGFIGFNREGRIEAPPAPAGEVAIEGLIFPSQEREGIGRSDVCDGTRDVLVRADVACIEAQVEHDLLSAYVQLTSSDPTQVPAEAGAPDLVALGPPEPDLGPHLGYAVQWFIFSTIAAGGYALLLWRVARERAREEELGAPDGGVAGSEDLDRELEELLRSEL